MVGKWGFATEGDASGPAGRPLHAACFRWIGVILVLAMGMAPLTAQDSGDRPGEWGMGGLVSVGAYGFPWCADFRFLVDAGQVGEWGFLAGYGQAIGPHLGILGETAGYPILGAALLEANLFNLSLTPGIGWRLDLPPGVDGSHGSLKIIVGWTICLWPFPMGVDNNFYRTSLAWTGGFSVMAAYDWIMPRKALRR